MSYELLNCCIKEEFALPEIFTYLDKTHDSLLVDSSNEQKQHEFQLYQEALQNHIKTWNGPDEEPSNMTLQKKLNLFHRLLGTIYQQRELIQERLSQFTKESGYLLVLFQENKYYESTKLITKIQQYYTEQLPIESNPKIKEQNETTRRQFLYYKLSHLAHMREPFLDILSFIQLKDSRSIPKIHMCNHEILYELIFDLQTDDSVNFKMLNEQQIVFKFLEVLLQRKSELNNQINEMRSQPNIQRMIAFLVKGKGSKNESIRILRALFDIYEFKRQRKIADEEVTPQKRVKDHLILIYLFYANQQQLAVTEFLPGLTIYSHKTNSFQIYPSQCLFSKLSDMEEFEEINEAVKIKVYLDMNKNYRQYYEEIINLFPKSQEKEQSLQMQIYYSLKIINSERQNCKDQLCQAFLDERIMKTINTIQTLSFDESDSYFKQEFKDSCKILISLYEYVLSLQQLYQSKVMARYYKLEEQLSENQSKLRRETYKTCGTVDIKHNEAIYKIITMKIMKLLLFNKLVFPEFLKYFTTRYMHAIRIEKIKILSISICINGSIIKWMEEDAEFQDFLKQCIETKIITIANYEYPQQVKILEIHPGNIQLPIRFEQMNDQTLLVGYLKLVNEQKELCKKKLIDLFKEVELQVFLDKLEMACIKQPRPLSFLQDGQRYMKSIQEYINQP